MAVISFTIPDAILPRVIAAVCARYRYSENLLPDETQAQFTRRMIVSLIKKEIRSAESDRVWQAAQAEANTLGEDTIE